MRAYVAAKQRYDQGTGEKDLSKRPKGPEIDLVRKIQWELNKERVEAKSKE